MIYRLSTLGINYTTYDLCRDFDTINPRTHPFVMVPSLEVEAGAHPFWYATVLCISCGCPALGQGITGFQIQGNGISLGMVAGCGTRAPFWLKACQAPKVGFVLDSDEFTFGFLDPSLVVRGCHLIPSFIDGKTGDLLRAEGSSWGWVDGKEDDWASYYMSRATTANKPRKY